MTRFVLIAALLCAGCESIIGLEDRKLGDPNAGRADAGDGDGDDERDAGDGDAGDGDVGDGDAGDGDAGGGPSEPCVEYCERVMDRCVDEYAVYPSDEVCLEVCARLPAGDSDDPTGNTIACRSQLARFITEPASDCPAAGPGGAGRCGENCESYCMLMDQVCIDEREESVETCIERCAAIRDRDDDPSLGANESRYSAHDSSARDHDGDTVQCRLFHTSVAAAPLGAEAHCWHAALAPRPLEGSGAINPCSRDVDQVEPRCADYCQHIEVACTGEHAVYENEAQCLGACEAMTPGDLTDNGGQNTRGCRNTHAYNALDGDPVIHCPHSGPGGNITCGDDCTSFCMQLQAACSDGYESEFGSGDPARTACEAACEPLLDGEPGLKFALATVDEEGTPPLACRMRAVLRAHADPSDGSLCEQALGLADCE